jgi:hypothetical protein
MSEITARALLVALGCPGPGQCDGLWPNHLWIRNYLPPRYEEHVEKHSRERLGLGDEDR